jgi:hypothetical protein
MLIRMRAVLFIAAILTAISLVHAEPVSLLDGKLKFDTTDAFILEKKATASKQSIAR